MNWRKCLENTIFRVCVDVDMSKNYNSNIEIMKLFDKKLLHYVVCGPSFINSIYTTCAPLEIFQGILMYFGNFQLRRVLIAFLT
jgi:hypothetical protein